jgi:hypothetical protein
MTVSKRVKGFAALQAVLFNPRLTGLREEFASQVRASQETQWRRAEQGDHFCEMCSAPILLDYRIVAAK